MKQEQRLIDVYLGRYRWYRKIVGGYWYKHQFTQDALEICVTFVGTWWARYGVINRYSVVIKEEEY